VKEDSMTFSRNSSRALLLGGTVLAGLLAFGGVSAAAPDGVPKILVVAVPDKPGPAAAEALNRLLDSLWRLGEQDQGLVLEVWNATRRERIARVAPGRNRADTQRIRRDGFGAVRRHLGADRSASAPGETDDLQIPHFLREVGSTIRNALPPGDAQLLFVGRAQHHDPRSPGHSMRDGLLPTDDAVLAAPEVSPYGTAGKASALAGVRIHICFTDTDWPSEPARLGTGRTYALMTTSMGGSAGSYAASSAGCTDRFLTGAPSPDVHAMRPAGRIAMYSAAHPPVPHGNPPPPPPAAAPPPPPPAPCVARPHVDVVLAVDATGSMRRVIQDVQQNAARLASHLRSLNPTNRLAVIAYRDHGDEFVVRSSAFVDLDEAGVATLNRFVMQLQAFGGGDDPEAIDAALEAAVALPWRPGVAGSIIVIGDAPVHPIREAAAFDLARDFARSGPARRVSVVETGSARHPFLRELPIVGGGQHLTYRGQILENLFPAIGGCAGR
jgi:hypothetical protein